VTKASAARDFGIDAASVLLLFGVGAHLRLGRLGAALVNGDSVGPYWKAATILGGAGWLPRSHAPESGPALYWAYVPFVALADSLEDAYAARFVAQALVGPLSYLAVRALTAGPLPATSRAVALAAGASLTFSAGLRQTLESGYQGYLSIELAAVVVAAFALAARRPGWAGAGLVAVPLAMMCHPLAVAYLLPALVLAAVAFRKAGPRSRLGIATGLLVAAGLGVLRLRQLAEPAFDSGTFDPSALAAIPGGNATGEGGLATVLASLGGIPDHDGAGWLLLLALLVPAALVKRARPAVAAAAGVVLGLAATGAAMDYLQPYHWRIAAPAVVTAVAVAATYVVGPRGPAWMVAVPAAAVLLAGALPWGPPAPTPADHARIASVAQQTSRGGWVEFGTAGDRMWGSPVAVRLEQSLRLGGVASEGPVHLLIAGPEALLNTIRAVPGDVEVLDLLPGDPALLLVALDDPRGSSAWTKAVCEVAPRFRIERRAIDYLRIERPDLPEAFISMWWDACTGANVGW